MSEYRGKGPVGTEEIAVNVVGRGKKPTLRLDGPDGHDSKTSRKGGAASGGGGRGTLVDGKAADLQDVLHFVTVVFGRTSTPLPRLGRVHSPDPGVSVRETEDVSPPGTPSTVAVVCTGCLHVSVTPPPAKPLVPSEDPSITGTYLRRVPVLDPQPKLGPPNPWTPSVRKAYHVHSPLIHLLDFRPSRRLASPGEGPSISQKTGENRYDTNKSYGLPLF